MSKAPPSPTDLSGLHRRLRASNSNGPLSRLTRRSAATAARRPKTTIALWLLMVVGLLIAGGMTGTQMLSGSEGGVGESARADRRVADSGLADRAVENVLVRSDDAAATGAAVADLSRRAAADPDVASVTGPAQSPENVAAGGREQLVQVSLRGPPEDAGDNVEGLQRSLDRVRAGHPGVELLAAGPGSIDAAIDQVVTEDLRNVELISLPVTLVILFIAFGALVAASVPLLLGMTSVMAAFGGMSLISQALPLGDATSSLVVLLGLAVGVDYSLFYIRREREERRAGRGERSALNATAATVGRAIVVSGLTVMVALAGLIVTGLPAFVSMALATILVVAIAVLGSLTVLPAVLALLGDRIDRGRLPFAGRISARAGRGRFWPRLAGAVTRRPAVSLVVTVCLLGTMAVPALSMDLADSDGGLPEDEPVMVAQRALERSFPGQPATADLVVEGERLDGAAATARLERLGERAVALAGGSGRALASVSSDGRTALLTVPMADRGVSGNYETVERLRDRLGPEGEAFGHDGEVMVTGHAARSLDFTDRLALTTPIVLAAVLALALILLVTSFRSLPLAFAVMGLNLVSIAATYGLLTLVFQHEWAEGLLGFTSNGTITNWVPLNTFVILFGLSMDYTIIVLERIREARRAGVPPRRAAAEGVASTAGTVTSAAVVMVAIFAIFPMLPLLEMKMLGVALAAGVLIDATLVRGVALPAAVALLGERGVPGPARADGGRRAWDHRGQLRDATTSDAS